MAKVLEVSVILSAVDRMTKVIDRATNNAATRLNTLSTKSDAIAKKAFQNGREFGAMGLAAAGALYLPIKAAADFETGLSDVRKVVDGLNDSKSINEMGQQIRVLSRELPIAQDELLQLVAAGGRMGVPKSELLDYTKLVAKMASAFDAPAAEIGEQMGRLATVFNIPIQKIGLLADAVNYLDDNAIAKGPDIIEVMRRVGGTAQQVGLAAPNVAALASTFLTLGSTAEKAGTASNALIRELSIATIQPGRFQDALARLGLQAGKIQKQMTIDPQGTILGVLEKINALPKDQQVQITTQLFGKEYGDDVAKLSQGLKEYRRQLELLNNPKLNGSVQREFAIRAQTSNAQLQIAKNNIREVSVVIGSALLPMFNRLISRVRPILVSFVGWVEKNQKLVATIGLIVAGFAAFSLAASGVSFLVGGFAKGISLLSSTLSVLSKVFGFVGKAIFFMGRMVMTNPILIIIGAIAIAAYLIYDNWGAIVVWFKNLWDKIKVFFLKAWEFIKNFFLNYNLFGLIIKHWGDITAFVNRFYEAGKKIVLAIWEGIKSLASKPVEAIKGIVGKIRDFLPFSPAKTGPLRDLHRVRIIETIAGTMKPGPMVSAMEGVAVATVQSGGRRGGTTRGPGGGLVVNFSPTINVGVGGMDTRGDILAVLRQYQPELVRLVEDAIARRDRGKF